jgi:hypothetical protein
MFKLNPSPTFKAPVKITVPGGEPLPIEFEFKHRTRVGLTEWQDGFVKTVPAPTENDPDAVRREMRPDREIIGEYIAGWSGVLNDAGLPEPWSVDAFLKLTNNYHAAASETFLGYLKALQESRAKN